MGKLGEVIIERLIKIASEHPELVENALKALLEWIPTAIENAKAKQPHA